MRHYCAGTAYCSSISLLGGRWGELFLFYSKGLGNIEIFWELLSEVLLLNFSYISPKYGYSFPRTFFEYFEFEVIVEKFQKKKLTMQKFEATQTVQSIYAIKKGKKRGLESKLCQNMSRTPLLIIPKKSPLLQPSFPKWGCGGCEWCFLLFSNDS